jgi:hypothetical protein
MFTIKGIDDKGLNVDNAWLVGKCHIEKLTGEDYNEIKAEYPYLEITYDELTSEVIFMDATGKIELYRETVTGFNSEAPDCKDLIAEGYFEKPTKEAIPKYTFEWTGWTRTFSEQVEETLSGTIAPDTAIVGEIQKDALQKITGTRILYPTFVGKHRAYPVHFINEKETGHINLQTINTLYGRTAQYTETIPQKQDVTSPEIYEFTGWEPKPENITEELTCYAQFTLLDEAWYSVTLADISDCVNSEGKPIEGYKLNSVNNTMEILECKNDLNPAVRIPTELSVEGTVYNVISVAGFASHKTLELLDLQTGLQTIGTRAFESCSNLLEFTIPDTVITIGTEAFKGCSKIKVIKIPVGVVSIADAAFAQCTKLNKITVDPGNSNFKIENDCLINTNTNRLIQGLNTGRIPETVKSLGNYCFANTTISKTIIPEGIEVIPNNAFSRCEHLVDVTLPSTIKSLDATCFAWCKSLSNINLPEGLTKLMTYIFAETALVDVVIPSTVTEINEMAFGNIKTLKTVTFKKSAGLPAIHVGAFSSTNGVTFNVPWAEGEVANAPWGALNALINYNYKEEA